MAKIGGKRRKNRQEESESGSPSSGKTQRTQTPVRNHSSVNHTPVTRRYYTRQSKPVLQSHTPASAPALKNVFEFSHSQVSTTPIIPSRSANMSGRSWTAIRGKPLDGEVQADCEPSSGEEWSFPTPEDITKFTSAIHKEDNPDEEVQDVTPLFVAEAVVNNHLPMENAHEGSTNIGTKGDHCGGSNNIGTKGDNCGGSPTRSVNFTEIAGMLDGATSDPDEVVSFTDPYVVTVHGYRVKEEVAPLLRVIISKYGDIAEKCTLKGITSRSIALEMLCGTVQRMTKLRFKEITDIELKLINTEISDLVLLGLEVGWLQQRAEKISKAMSLFKGAATLNEARTKNRMEVAQNQKEMEMLEQKLSSVKEKGAALKAEGDKINQMVEETKSTLKCFLGGESLVEGML